MPPAPDLMEKECTCPTAWTALGASPGPGICDNRTRVFTLHTSSIFKIRTVRSVSPALMSTKWRAPVQCPVPCLAQWASAAYRSPPLPGLAVSLADAQGWHQLSLVWGPYKGQAGMPLVHIRSQCRGAGPTSHIPRHAGSSGKPPTPGRPGTGAHEYFMVEFLSRAASQAALCLILPSRWLTPSPPLPLVNSRRSKEPFAAK